ncbi:ComEC/Rec2 family competence protein [Effusibacillus dendaii]|uniref:ComEC/Rec2 family competence protein n=1 Tax=Effusibacillus dendaii TaxID=2743772 RepID=UPI00190CAF12|nr:ComEC/Rec2 family competence protein [Effusibacillus dendaii]
MRRTLFRFVICFLAGVVCAGFVPSQSPPVLIVSALVSFSIVCFGWWITHRQHRPFPVSLLMVCFLFAGFLYSQTYDAFHPNLLTPYYQKSIIAYGEVVSASEKRNGKYHYTVLLDHLQAGNEKVSLTDRVEVTDVRTKEQLPAYGTRVELRSILQEPSPARNPGGYDDRKVLARKVTHGRITVRTEAQCVTYGKRFTFYGFLMEPLRQHTEQTIQTLFPSTEADLIGGLVMGFANELPDEWKSAFQSLSLTHLLAASGMNVGLIAGSLFFLLKRLRFPKRLSDAMVICIIVIFVSLAGAGPSVVRAGLMAALAVFGSAHSRKADFFTMVAVAALISVLYLPMVTSDVGFQLSFVTTIGLFLLTPRIASRLPGPRWIRSALAITIAAQIASLPILIYFFNRVSPFSLAANLYAMPLMFVLVPVGFAVIVLGSVHPWLAIPFVGLVRVLVWCLMKPIVWLSNVTAEFTWTIASPPTWGVWLIYLLLLLLLFWRQAAAWLERQFGQYSFRTSGFIPAKRFKGWGSKAAIGTGFLLVLLLAAYLLQPKPLRVTFLDVGQGDSALIETPGGQAILVDGGGTPSFLESDFDPGESIVLPFLRHQGISAIDYLVVTHADEDHVKGLLAVINQVQIRHLIVSGYDDPARVFQQILGKAKEKNIPVYRSLEGVGWPIEPGVFWRFLHPGAIRTGTRSDANANCIVFELSYGRRSFLFTGDIDGEEEPDLFPYLHPVDVLKVAHHGSQHSSTEEFLARSRPQVAVISVGKRNLYHHPSPQTIKNLTVQGATVFRTDQSGAVTITTDGNRLQIETVMGQNKISVP